MYRIRQHGGKIVQVARSQKNVIVVYDGSTIRESSRVLNDVISAEDFSTAYDIRMIMDKGAIDIIKPIWITDSIAKGELVPMRKKCVRFLFA